MLYVCGVVCLLGILMVLAVWGITVATRRGCQPLEAGIVGGLALILSLVGIGLVVAGKEAPSPPAPLPVVTPYRAVPHYPAPQPPTLGLGWKEQAFQQLEAEQLTPAQLEEMLFPTPNDKARVEKILERKRIFLQQIEDLYNKMQAYLYPPAPPASKPSASKP